MAMRRLTLIAGSFGLMACSSPAQPTMSTDGATLVRPASIVAIDNTLPAAGSPAAGSPSSAAPGGTRHQNLVVRFDDGTQEQYTVDAGPWRIDDRVMVSTQRGRVTLTRPAPR